MVNPEYSFKEPVAKELATKLSAEQNNLTFLEEETKNEILALENNTSKNKSELVSAVMEDMTDAEFVHLMDVFCKKNVDGERKFKDFSELKQLGYLYALIHQEIINRFGGADILSQNGATDAVLGEKSRNAMRVLQKKLGYIDHAKEDGEVNPTNDGILGPIMLQLVEENFNDTNKRTILSGQSSSESDTTPKQYELKKGEKVLQSFQGVKTESYEYPPSQLILRGNRVEYHVKGDNGWEINRKYSKNMLENVGLTLTQDTGEVVNDFTGTGTMDYIGDGSDVYTGTWEEGELISGTETISNGVYTGNFSNDGVTFPVPSDANGIFRTTNGTEYTGFVDGKYYHNDESIYYDELGDESEMNTKTTGLKKDRTTKSNITQVKAQDTAKTTIEDAPQHKKFSNEEMRNKRGEIKVGEGETTKNSHEGITKTGVPIESYGITDMVKADINYDENGEYTSGKIIIAGDNILDVDFKTYDELIRFGNLMNSIIKNFKGEGTKNAFFLGKDSSLQFDNDRNPNNTEVLSSSGFDKFPSISSKYTLLTFLNGPIGNLRQD